MKKAVMYGAGNIGRGFIGELFSLSGYSVSFIDVNKEIIGALNARGEYVVEVLSNDSNEEITVKNVCGVDGMDADAVSTAIAECDVMATAVGVNILPRIVGNIANGLKLRWKNGNKTPLNIIICENMIDADKFLAESVKNLLNDEEKKLFDGLIGTVEASIGRMVPIQTPEMTKNDILRVCVEPFCNLIVDKDGFKGEIPEIKNMSAFAPFRLYIERKLFLHNMGHSLTAYLGNLKGYEYIWEAIEDTEIEVMAMRAMCESALALSIRYNVPFKALFEHVEDLLFRFTNKKLGDTVFRVGRDLNRKLSPEDRIVGAIHSCLDAGVKPYALYAAYAAALKFEADDISKIPAEEVMQNISKLDKNSEEYKEILEFVDVLEKSNGISGMIKLLKSKMDATK